MPPPIPNPQSLIPTLLHRDRKAVSAWLMLCLLLVTLMVVIGGYTRLSGSGLSITEWKPIHGTLPPLSQAEWDEEFDAYKQSPQYRKVNTGMSLDEFKTIFWPEYLHRLLGRLVGFVVLLPLAVFGLRKSFTRRFGLRIAGIFLLGGLQGLIGWLMVKSGLIDNPAVSHFRLALHLSIAFVLFALLLWTILDIRHEPAARAPRTRALCWYKSWLTLLCLQIILGAFVAGLHAGLIYNTFPTMNGQWLPDGMFMRPWLENIGLVQFLHRWMAVAVAVGFLFWWFFHKEHVKNGRLGKACSWVAVVILFQFLLGVATLLHQVPLPLALAHQFMALVLFGLGVYLLHRLVRKRTIQAP